MLQKLKIITNENEILNKTIEKLKKEKEESSSSEEDIITKTIILNLNIKLNNLQQEKEKKYLKKK